MISNSNVIYTKKGGWQVNTYVYKKTQYRIRKCLTNKKPRKASINRSIYILLMARKYICFTFFKRNRCSW